VPVFALKHAKKQIAAKDPCLTDEGLEEFENLLKEKLGTVLTNLKVQQIFRGSGRRFEETYLAASYLFPGIPVKIFQMLGSEYSRVDIFIDEEVSSNLVVEYKEVLVTTPGEVIKLDDFLSFDDPCFKGIAWECVQRIDEHFPGVTLLICTRDFFRSLGQQETAGFFLGFLDYERKKVHTIA